MHVEDEAEQLEYAHVHSDVAVGTVFGWGEVEKGTIQETPKTRDGWGYPDPHLKPPPPTPPVGPPENLAHSAQNLPSCPGLVSVSVTNFSTPTFLDASPTKVPAPTSAST